MGETVIVYETGLVGLGVVAACRHRRCVVVAVNIKDQQLTIAKTLETDFAFDGRANDIAEEVERIAPEGTDVVLECTGIPQCIDPAIALCREHGSFVWQGHYGNEPVSMHFIRPHARRLRMFFPCDDTAGNPGGEPS